MREPTELLSKQVMVRMTPGLLLLLKRIAKQDKRKVSDVVRLAVEEYVERRLTPARDEAVA